MTKVNILFLLCLPAHIVSSEPINMGNRLELFVDDYLVHNFEGDVHRKLVLPQPREVVFVADAAWEGNTSGYYTFFQDGEVYRMVYRGWQHESQRSQLHPPVACLAESRDGIQWTRPNLGLFEWDGSRSNNIIWLKSPETHNFTAFKDPNPAAKGQQYKALGGHKKGHLYGLVSDDCKNWTRVQAEPVITAGYFDSQNLAFWDPVRSEYRAYWRIFTKGVRAIRTATSQDFVKWENQADLKYPQGTPTQHLYTNAIQPYFRAPHLFIGFPTRYLPKEGQRVEPILMSSRDGLNFQRWNDPVISEDAPKDRKGNRSNYMAWGMLSLPGKPNEISMYATEAYYGKVPGRVRRFTYRTDGFVALNSADEGGMMETKLLRHSGTQLVLNYAVRLGGLLRVEALNSDGKTVGRSVELKGDHIESEVAWETAPPWQEKSIRLRFRMKQADVYSLQFK